MSSEVLVSVENVSKKFCKDLKTSLWYGAKDLGSEFLGLNSKKDLRDKEFWAVKDISFELKRGECLSLIGHNGAGKSTLLKILNGLIKPDRGRITMRGRVGALIELGAGFNPLLTGRENVYINGQILGFSRREIDQKFDAIMDFSELEDFIDTPVQNYSSGMKVRLGFAIAAQMEPDILIIDEVLAVGDMGFVLKCFRTIDNLSKKAAIIFVSHSMPQVARISTDLILMKKGEGVYKGKNVSEGIDMYYQNFSFGPTNFAVTGEIVITEVSFPKAANKQEVYVIKRGEDLEVAFKFKAIKKHKELFSTVTIYDKEQRPIGICFGEKAIGYKNVFDEEYFEYVILLTMPAINLSKGLYSITLGLSEGFRTNTLLRVQSVASFQVSSEHAIWAPIHFQSVWN